MMILLATPTILLAENLLFASSYIYECYTTELEFWEVFDFFGSLPHSYEHSLKIFNQHDACVT